jgi:hypothetical protein
LEYIFFLEFLHYFYIYGFAYAAYKVYNFLPPRERLDRLPPFFDRFLDLLDLFLPPDFEADLIIPPDFDPLLERLLPPWEETFFTAVTVVVMMSEYIIHR